MKSVNFRAQHNSKQVNTKSKVLCDSQKLLVKSVDIRKDKDTSKPESLPNGWTPRRNWHQYFGGEPRPLSPLVTAPSLRAPPLTLEPIPLPTVHFCSAERDSVPICAPSIIDLCDQDKRKIALLVEELAKCKQQKSEDEDIILKLKCKLAKLKTTLKSLEEEKQSELKTVSSLKSEHLQEQAALKEQVSELNRILSEMQAQKKTSEAQTRRIASQAEKMTQAIHSLHKENLQLKEDLATAKERLGAAHMAVEKMTKDLQEVQERIKPTTADKACQSTEDILTESVYVKPNDTSNKVHREQEIISELFFNKTIQNNMSSKETIILLPADIKLPYTNF